MSSIFLTLLLTFLVGQVSAKDRNANYYLGLSASELFSASTGGNRVGKCYIVPKAARGACDMYVKSAIVGSDGDRGWPKNRFKRGTGCVRAPFLPRRVRICYYSRSEYDLPASLVATFCTDDGKSNSIAMLRHAIKNNACGLDNSTGDSSSDKCPKQGPSVSLPRLISLDRIRRCRNRFFFCNSVVTRPEYGVFGHHRMSKKHQKKVFISQVNVPPKEKTRNIVFAVAGQQFRLKPFGNGDSSGTTGQQGNYESGFRRKTGSLTKSISPSLVSSIMDTGYFQLSDTFIGLVFDARFNYEFSKKRKNRNENGYYHYLIDRLGPSVGTIYLAGHSRGGCLVMRLASRLSQRYPNARIIVHNVDGVCTKPGFFASSEFGVGEPTRRNPFNSNYYVYTTNMEERFVNRKCLSIHSFLSGQEPVKIGNLSKQFRAFGHRFTGGASSPNFLRTTSKFAWYTEAFYNLGHFDISRYNYNTAVNHLENSMKNLPCSCGQ